MHSNVAVLGMAEARHVAQFSALAVLDKLLDGLAPRGDLSSLLLSTTHKTNVLLPCKSAVLSTSPSPSCVQFKEEYVLPKPKPQ